MILNNNSKDIILISYPSGGFGNFLYYILTEVASDTVKTDNSHFDFSNNGNSHTVNKYTSIYASDPDKYSTDINIDFKNKKVLILCDNGINNDQYSNITRIFPNAKILRLVIDHSVRPIIYQTCVLKALNYPSLTNDINSHVKSNWVDSYEDYAIRENFTLLYHNWIFKWDYDPLVINVSIESLITNPVSTITSLISKLEMTVIDKILLEEIANNWLSSNQKYFNIYYTSKTIIAAIETNTNIDISHVTDLHDQGYINYCIEILYDITIPVFDYKDWFQSTHQIITAINYIKSK